MYATQVFNLSTDYPHVEAWGLLPLSIIIDGEVEKLVERYWLSSFIKMSVLLLNSQDSG